MDRSLPHPLAALAASATLFLTGLKAIQAGALEKPTLAVSGRIWQAGRQASKAAA